MKTVFKFALMGLAASLFVLGCSKSDTTPENSTTDTDKQAVNVNFVFSVSTGNTPMTKMTAANTQADVNQTFRGLSDALLLTHRLGIANNGKYVTTDANPADKSYQLGTLIGSDGLHPNSTTANAPISHRVIELALPIETNALMFYGKAPKSGTDKAQGKIDFSYGTDNKNFSNFAFSLSPRVAEGTDRTSFTNTQNLMAAAINHIVDAYFTGELTFGSTTQNVTVKWSDYVDITAAAITAKANSPVEAKPMSPLGEILADAFIAFNTVLSGEVRAGSAPAVRRQMQDLYQVVSKVAESVPTSFSELVASNVAQRIETAIGDVFQSPSGSCDWKSAANIVSGISYSGSITGVTALAEFPTNAPFNLPLGACQLKVALDATNQKAVWSYANNVTALLGTDATDVFNFMWPAELCYFGNSPIRVTVDSHVPDEYPDGVGAWDTDTEWAAGVHNNTNAWEKNSHVHSTTRSVAMQENINYGSALLKSTVQYATLALKDNNHAIQKAKNPSLPDTDEPDKVINVSGDSFTLNGILIGGQNQTAGWNYLPKGTTAFNKVIYDNDLASTAIPGTAGTASTPNYTLVWDNWNESLKGSQQNIVYVALEFVNKTGVDFWGNKNIVRNGGTFYIVGVLNPDKISVSEKTASEIEGDKSLGITWPEHYALPPYGTDGKTLKERRVFMQDYMTTANFVIGENSLKSAYVTVPDLRSTQLSLGLSVDLVWSTGLVFDNIILGQ